MRITVGLDDAERSFLQELVGGLARHAGTPTQEFAVAGFAQKLKAETVLDLKDLTMLMTLIADVGAGSEDGLRFAREVNAVLKPWVAAVNALKA